MAYTLGLVFISRVSDGSDMETKDGAERQNWNVEAMTSAIDEWETWVSFRK